MSSDDTKRWTTVAPDPVIAAVMSLNAGYENKNYSRRQPDTFGNGVIHTVVFQDQRGNWYENYVSEVRGRYKAYGNLRDLLNDRGSGLLPSRLDPETMTTAVLAASSVLLLAVITYIVTVGSDQAREALEVVTGLFGLTIGYLVGKARGTPT